MAKYDPLSDYLRRSPDVPVETTFDATSPNLQATVDRPAHHAALGDGVP